MSVNPSPTETITISESASQNATQPGMPPGPSQQGQAGTCTPHSLGKTICAAGEKGGINFPQDGAIEQCINIGGSRVVRAGGFPTDWSGSSVFLKENGVSGGSPKDKTYKATLNIEKCKKCGSCEKCKKDEICERIKYDPQNKEYVLVVNTDKCPCLQTQAKNLHCVYVEKRVGNSWFCWNSWGQHRLEDMEIDVNILSNQLYEVTVDIQEVNLDEVLNITSTGGAGTAWSQMMGTYKLRPNQLHNNHPVWKMDNMEHYLCVNQHGKWVLAVFQNLQLQEVVGNDTTPAPNSLIELQSGWFYKDASTAEWKEDKLLKMFRVPGAMTTEGENKKEEEPTGLDLLISKASPLFTAFDSAKAKSYHLKLICEEMKLPGYYESLMTGSPELKEMRGKMKELLNIWFEKKGKSVATVTNLIQILKSEEVGLRATAEYIEEKRKIIKF